MAKGMMIYCIFNGDDTDWYFPKLADACAYAQECADDRGEEVEVQRHEITPDVKGRALACLLLGGTRWSVGHHVVRTIKPRKPKKEK